MWMEEHIGKRINHERVDEALATGATTVATACPFCRVMVTDGVNDRQEAAGREGVDVRDVAQLLLEALDRDSITLPEKGAAAKQAAEHAEKAAPKAETAPAATEPETADKTEKKDEAAPDKGVKAVTGLGISGGAKRPGAKKAAPIADTAEASPAAEPDAKAPAAPVKGLGIAGGAKRPGAKKTAAQPEASTQTAAAPQSEPAEQTEATPEPVAKAPAAPVKGLGIAAGAKRPGAKKTAASPEPKPEAAAKPEPEPEAKEEPQSKSADSDGDANGEAAPQPPVKGLGVARGARPPGKR
jgi:hypothetical protein